MDSKRKKMDEKRLERKLKKLMPK